MKNILVFGAGKSATSLIRYLLREIEKYGWTLTLVDSNLELALSKLNASPNATAKSIDVSDVSERGRLVSVADIVISLLPPTLHILVANDCIQYRKNLLTASYVDEQMRALNDAAVQHGLLFLCEMGLDPGIDHMSAIKILHRIEDAGGTVTSFRSHCGGLVAPESDDNPWHYKISWNPRNVVNAGKNGAIFLEDGETRNLSYTDLFDASRIVEVPGLGQFAWYPNRDSLSYIDIYRLGSAKTFVRTTLRHPEFVFGWRNLIDLHLTDDEKVYDTDGMTVQAFFQQHFKTHGFGNWIETQLTSRLKQSNDLLARLQELMLAEEEMKESNDKEQMKEFMMINEKGDLNEFNLDQVKSKAAQTVAAQMHEANISMRQLFHLGMADDQTVINRGICSAADVLQFILEQKLALGEDDKDMIVMLHEIEYRIKDNKHTHRSSLVVTGRDSLETAMAQTVGLPLGIVAKLILQGNIQLTGVQIPIYPEIYMPVLNELEEFGVRFEEEDF